MLMIKYTTTILGLVAFLARIGHPLQTAATVPVGHHFGRFHAKLQSTQESVSTERNRLATELLTAAKEVGQVGKLASVEDRHRIDQLALRLKPYSDPKPARTTFTGTHSLVYSGSDSGPTSGLVGPFVGKVTQYFCNETVYQNRVQFGPLQVSIFGEREPLSDSDIQVRFYRTQVHAWGKRLVDRNVDLWHAPGLWEHIFVGKVEVEGETWLLRVMNTPKLFILRQRVG